MKVFLSSTAQDLVAYRQVTDDTIQRLSQQTVAMERFGPLPGTPVEECERLARESDVVVCIVAHRYGFVPEKGNGSITRREVKAAKNAGKDVLVWIVDDNFPWTEKKEQDLLADPNVLGDPARVTEVAEHVAALIDFKAWLRTTFTPETFTTADDLGKKVAVGLSNYIAGHSAPPLPQDRISIARLPTSGAELFGRETELQLLDDAWSNEKTNIVSFVAWGGVGKTALVNHWLKKRMARDNYRGAECVYGWSFFSQGTSERAASADLFVDQALRWFGDKDPTAGSPWDKGERLANYIRQSRTLLILDGLEPLQHPPGPQEGRLKDAAMQSLLVELAAQQRGLCVISTRERIGDLVEFEDGTVVQHNLEHLSPQAGAQILRSLNVKGDDEELELASQEFGGHAFSLTLLGSYLEEVFQGDIGKRKEIENLFEDTRYGEKARAMISAYERWLGEGMELAILRLLGFFDRPADIESIVSLREAPAITGLTETLQHFKAREWNQAVAKLRRIKLLAEATDDAPGTLDAHPLLREHFKQQLKRERPDAWREGNKRLYEYFKNSAKEFPDTLEEMSPLYAAITHGCAAGRYREAWNGVYMRRIQRGEEMYSIKKLGAAGTELAVIAGFFTSPWEQLEIEVNDVDRPFILATSGFHLHALGRLTEAAQPIHAALLAALSRSDWSNASIAAANLAELYLTIGNLTEALKYAEQAISLADRGGLGRDKMANRTVMAEALHQTGRHKEAEAMFLIAERLQRQNQPQLPLLWSLEGFRYLSLLLDEGRYEEVQERANRTIEWVRRAQIVLDVALDQLAIGRSILLNARRLKEAVPIKARTLIQSGVDGLRRAGYLQSLPRGILARAELYRFTKEYSLAAHDLMEVGRMATRSGMGLHLADYHLESARLELAQSDKEKAREHWTTAKKMVDRMGYHRRDKEVKEIGNELG